MEGAPSTEGEGEVEVKEEQEVEEVVAAKKEEAPAVIEVVTKKSSVVAEAAAVTTTKRSSMIAEAAVKRGSVVEEAMKKSSVVEATKKSSVVAEAAVKPVVVEETTTKAGVKEDLVPPFSPVTTKPPAKSQNEEVVNLLVSIHIPQEDAVGYAAILADNGFENVELLAHIEKEDFEEMPTIKKLAHKKAIIKWAVTFTTGRPPAISTIFGPPSSAAEASSASAAETETVTPTTTTTTTTIQTAAVTTPSESKATEVPSTVKVESISAPPVSPTNQDAAAAQAPEKKKVFSVKASPMCGFCGKTVYKTEETTNSKSAVFHKECLRCTSCKASLAGKEPVTIQTGPIRTAQYRVEEGTGNLLCDKHAVSRVNVVQGASKDTKSRRQSEIDKVEKETHEKNLQVRDSMQYSIGDLTPVCNRCGNALEKEQQIIVSGMERFHAVCPTAEEAAKMIRSVRFFAKKLPERLATTFICDKVTKHPHTFLYEIDKDSVTEAMKLKKHETTVILFKPDTNAHASVKRKLQVPGNGNREFEINVRDMDGFTFEDIKGRKGDKPGPIVKAIPKTDAKTLEVVKYKLQNGVLQTLTAKYGYDESIEHIEPRQVSFKLEMWPPFDPEKEKANDPLANLRGQLRMRETRGESLAADDDLSAATAAVASMKGASTTAASEPSSSATASQQQDDPAPLNAEPPPGRKTGGGLLGRMFGGGGKKR